MKKEEIIEGKVIGSELTQILNEQGVGDDNKRQLVEAFGGPFNEIDNQLAGIQSLIAERVKQL